MQDKEKQTNQVRALQNASHACFLQSKAAELQHFSLYLCVI